jgi:hypothetical protein
VLLALTLPALEQPVDSFLILVLPTDATHAINDAPSHTHTRHGARPTTRRSIDLNRFPRIAAQSATLTYSSLPGGRHTTISSECSVARPTALAIPGDSAVRILYSYFFYLFIIVIIVI